MVLYNGEIGLYTVVIVDVAFDRGGSVEVKGKVAHCTCNGEVLEAAFELPGSGPIGLEGDRGQMEYRRIRLRKN